MKKIVIIKGNSLYIDKGKFYSSNPKEMEELLKQTAISAEHYSDRFASMWILEDIRLSGGIAQVV